MLLFVFSSAPTTFPRFADVPLEYVSVSSPEVLISALVIPIPSLPFVPSMPFVPCDGLFVSVSPMNQLPLSPICGVIPSAPETPSCPFSSPLLNFYWKVSPSANGISSAV